MSCLGKLLAVLMLAGALILPAALAQGRMQQVAPATQPMVFSLELPGVPHKEVVCTATSAVPPLTASCVEEPRVSCSMTEVGFRMRPAAPVQTCKVSCQPSRTTHSASSACTCTLRTNDCR